MAQTFRERIDAPESTSDGREIWMTIRSWITILRIILVIAIIITAEIFEEHNLLNMSLSVWAIVVGFPLFLLLSMIIIQGDKRFAPDLEEKRRKKIDNSS
jgi:O-antigen/teichoic acid export membrane protein|tara:strand:+ start:452 stop:751 length:300 start_codon:yes stop_codon:yes gene_type:complete